MDSVPVELLSRIFINALPPDLDDARYQVHDPVEVQAVISCVCQQWNRIAKSAPGLWTFIILSNKSRSHNTMKRGLGLSGNLPLNVSIRLARKEPDSEYWGNPEVWENESFYEMHALLVEQVLRWKTLRVEARVEVPSELRRWIPSELPNVAGLSLHLVVLGYVPQDDMDSREPFISAPRLTFCGSDSPVTFPLTYCPLLQEYHATGIGFLELIDPSRTSIWRRLVTILSQDCPRLEVLQVKTDSGNVQPSVYDASHGDWPVLPSLNTLRFANGATSMGIRILLAELKAPQLRRVEFRDYLIIAALTQDIQFPVENNGRIFLSMMSAANVTELLARITNAADLQVQLDLDSIIGGDPRSRKADMWESRRDPAVISQLRGWWESVRENIPKVSWVVPSDEQEGSWKRLGGADLLFDDAIAYLDRRRGIWLQT